MLSFCFFFRSVAVENVGLWSLGSLIVIQHQLLGDPIAKALHCPNLGFERYRIFVSLSRVRILIPCLNWNKSSCLGLMNNISWDQDKSSMSRSTLYILHTTPDKYRRHDFEPWYHLCFTLPYCPNRQLMKVWGIDQDDILS